MDSNRPKGEPTPGNGADAAAPAAVLTGASGEFHGWFGDHLGRGVGVVVPSP
jgi:hypothetical protein